MLTILEKELRLLLALSSRPGSNFLLLFLLFVMVLVKGWFLMYVPIYLFFIQFLSGCQWRIRTNY